MNKKFTTIYLYLTVFFAGFVILIIEILGTRVLAPFYGSTIYVWSSLIAVTMAFLALGYAIGGVLADRLRPARVISLCLFFAVVFILLIAKIDAFVLLKTESLGMRFGPLTAAAVLFSAPLFFLGAITPVSVKLRTAALNILGANAGSLYAVATLGSLSGALLAGFYLISNFSITVIFNGAAVLLALTLFYWLYVDMSEKKTTTHPLTMLTVLLAAGIITAFCYWPSSGLISDKKIIFHEQSFYGDIKIVTAGPYQCLFVNAQMQSCANAQKTTDEVYIQIVKELLARAKPKTVLVVGLGGGSMLSVLPDNAQVDVVELDEKLAAVVKAHDFLPAREFSLYIDDARHFIRTSEKTYDIVIVDALIGDSLPYYLFSQEALAEISDILNPNGALAINTAAELAPEDLFSRVLIKTIQDTFSETVVITGSGSYTPRPVIAAFKQPDVFDISGFSTVSWPKQTGALAINDDFNPLEGYYLPHALSLRAGNRALGDEVYLAH